MGDGCGAGKGSTAMRGLGGCGKDRARLGHDREECTGSGGGCGRQLCRFTDGDA